KSQRFHSFILILLISFSSWAYAKLNLVQQVDDGVWRGSQPKSKIDFARLQEMGIKVIINIQRADDKSVAPEKAAAENLGFKFIQIPLVAKDRPADENIDEIFRELLRTKNHPVYLH